MKPRNFIPLIICMVLAPFIMAPGCLRGTIDQFRFTEDWVYDDICLSGFIELTKPYNNIGVDEGPVVPGPIDWRDGIEYDYLLMDNKPYLKNLTTDQVYPLIIEGAGGTYHPLYIWTNPTTGATYYAYNWTACGVELAPWEQNHLVLRNEIFIPNPQDPNQATWKERTYAEYKTFLKEDTIVIPVTVHLMKSRFPNWYGVFDYGVDMTAEEAKRYFDNRRGYGGETCTTQYTVGSQCPYRDIALDTEYYLVKYTTMTDYLWAHCGIQFRAVEVRVTDPYDYYVSDAYLVGRDWSEERIELNARMKSICLSKNWGYTSRDRECLPTLSALNNNLGVKETVNVFFMEELRTCQCAEYEGMCLRFCDELDLSRDHPDCQIVCEEYVGRNICGTFTPESGNFAAAGIGDPDFMVIASKSATSRTSSVMPHELGHVMELYHVDCEDNENLMWPGSAACVGISPLPTYDLKLDASQCETTRNSPATEFRL